MGAAILWPPLDESVYGKAPMHMTACEAVIGLPGAVEWEERMAAVVLLNEVC